MSQPAFHYSLLYLYIEYTLCIKLETNTLIFLQKVKNLFKEFLYLDFISFMFLDTYQ